MSLLSPKQQQLFSTDQYEVKLTDEDRNHPGTKPFNRWLEDPAMLFHGTSVADKHGPHLQPYGHFGSYGTAVAVARSKSHKRDVTFNAHKGLDTNEDGGVVHARRALVPTYSPADGSHVTDGEANLLSLKYGNDTPSVRESVGRYTLNDESTHAKVDDLHKVAETSAIPYRNRHERPALGEASHNLTGLNHPFIPTGTGSDIRIEGPNDWRSPEHAPLASYVVRDPKVQTRGYWDDVASARANSGGLRDYATRKAAEGHSPRVPVPANNSLAPPKTKGNEYEQAPLGYNHETGASATALPGVIQRSNDFKQTRRPVMDSYKIRSN